MRCITRLIFALCLFAGTAHAARNGMSHINPSESGMGYGGGTFAGPIAWCVLTQVADDTTPDVGVLGGCAANTGGNIIKTSTAHGAPVAITDFGSALVGQVIYVHGSGGANATTIANASNFTLEADWTGTLNNELVLWTIAASTFIELGRHNGPRTFNDLLNLSSAESVDNAVDGDIRFTGIGGTNNEDAIFDLETTADTIGIETGTGVTLWDWGAIGLAAGSADMSEGNITNVGDIQLDSLTADAIGVGLAGVAITESAATDTTLSITHELNDTGAPDATEDFTALKVDVTETDKTGWATVNLMDLQVGTASKFLVTDTGLTTVGAGMSLAGGLDMNSNAVTEVTSLGGSNAEVLDNLTDGSWVMTGVGGTNNEDLEIDLEASADTVILSSSTGVTTWDWGAIGLACGTADLSEGNLTNAGDLQADSVTADGTALQTNATTTVLQQNLDLAAGNAMTLDSHVDAELTAASGSQSFVQIAPEILQTSTAQWIALEVDVTESSEGSVTDYLLSLEVANAAKLTVDSDGALACVDATLSGTMSVDAVVPEANNGVGLTGVTITESGATDTTLSLAHTLNDTGAPDATEDFTALKVDVTETDKTGWATVNLIDLQVDTVSKFKVTDAGAVTYAGGMSLGGDLDMNSHAVTEVTSLGGSNAETLNNLTDGSWIMTGVGSTNNEDAEFDFEVTADTVTVSSSTGVTTWEFGAIGLAAGNADLSDGNLTNVGDVQTDSVTADGTALQANSSTLILQQNADLAAGNAVTIDSEADAELTAASGSQSFVKIAPEILQTSTAGYIALEIDVTESSEGSVTDYLASFEVADAAKFTVDSDGNTVVAGTLSVTGEVDFTADLALTAGGSVTTTADGDLDLTPNGTGVVDVTDAEVYIGDGTYSWTHTPILACEGILEIDGAAYMDSSLTVATTTTMNGALTLDDTGASVNSPMISLKGDSAGTEVEGQIQLMYGADPYIRISVDDDDSTPVMTAVIDIHDAAISFSNDNSTDLGATGANRPKDLYLAGNATIGQAGLAMFAGRSEISSPADGSLLVTDDAGTDFGLLQFGGTTSSFPALKRATTGLYLRLADDSAFAPFTSLSYTAATSISAGSTSAYNWSTRSRFVSSADGLVNYTNAAGTGFTALTLGPETVAGIRLKVNGDMLELHEGDESTRVSFGAEDIVSYGTFIQAAAGGYYSWTGRSEWYSASDGEINGTADDGSTPANLTMANYTSTGATLTESGNSDTNISITRTLNDTGAPDASEDFSAIFADVIITDATGWATTNLMDLQVDSGSVFKVATSGVVTFTGVPVFPTREKEVILQLTAGGVNPSTVPDLEFVGTYVGYGFDHDDEYFVVQWDIAEDWDAATDMTMHIHWVPQAGDILQNAETVKIDCTYRSTDTHTPGNQAYDAGSVVSITNTYTEAGTPGIDKQWQLNTYTLDYDHGDQALAATDQVGLKCDRDVTGDTYTGEIVIVYVSIYYNSTELSTR